VVEPVLHGHSDHPGRGEHDQIPPANGWPDAVTWGIANYPASARARTTNS
jgi:hypothetical protein